MVEVRKVLTRRASLRDALDKLGLDVVEERLGDGGPRVDRKRVPPVGSRSISMAPEGAGSWASSSLGLAPYHLVDDLEREDARFRRASDVSVLPRLCRVGSTSASEEDGHAELDAGKGRRGERAGEDDRGSASRLFDSTRAALETELSEIQRAQCDRLAWWGELTGQC